MVNSNYIRVGRLVRILRGPRQDRVAVVTDIIDGNRVLVENPSDSKMWRHVQNLKNVEPLKFACKISGQSSTKSLAAAIDSSKVLDKWSKTPKATRIVAKKAVESATDFERYQIRVAKRSRAHWARKIFDAKDSKTPVSWHKVQAKKLERAHTKFADKKMKERHVRIKKYMTARKAKKAKKGKGKSKK